MRRLKMELKHTMEMYNSACKEAISAKKAVCMSFQQSKANFSVRFSPNL